MNRIDRISRLSGSIESTRTTPIGLGQDLSCNPVHPVSIWFRLARRMIGGQTCCAAIRALSYSGFSFVSIGQNGGGGVPSNCAMS